jgi:hypothetical protein
LILSIFYLFLFINENKLLYKITILFLISHSLALIFQAFLYPQMQYFIASIWGTNVANNIDVYQYRFIGLAGSYVPASILSALLFVIYFFSKSRTSILNRYFLMLLAFVGCALSARTGILLCASVVILNTLINFIFSKNNVLKLFTIFLFAIIIFFFSSEGASKFFVYFEKQGLGVIYQLEYITRDVVSHFSQDWGGTLSLLDYVIGTGSLNFSPGDNGYTMFLSQHGLIVLILSLIPYTYLLSKKNLKIAICLGSVIFLGQLKTEFLFSIIYMLLTLVIIKNI